MTVDAYLATLSPERQARVAAVRDLVHRVAPGVVERIDWKMPVFAIGDRWVAVASQKSYISVYLGTSGDVASVLASDPLLKGGKACVNIPDRADLPLAALEPAIRDVLTG
jgi:uncharacterized protein YdhG (YjbR/CyaY superfamily)